jgi:hypothetical protein
LAYVVEDGWMITCHLRYEIDPAQVPAFEEYAQAYLRRIRAILEGRMATDDLAALDTLIDSDGPDGVLHRNDLVVRGTRTAWIARRP